MGSSTNQGRNQTGGKAQPESVLQEAHRIINGERRTDYGGAEESFDQIAQLWSIVLERETTAEEVALCMMMLKISRYLHGAQRDSVVDLCGYAGLLEVLDCLK